MSSFLGFDKAGCEQLGGKLHGTTKWIGTTEVVALLRWAKIKWDIFPNLNFYRYILPLILLKAHSCVLSSFLCYFQLHPINLKFINKKDMVIWILPPQLYSFYRLWFSSYFSTSSARIVDFHKPTSPENTHVRLFEWVDSYFKQRNKETTLPPFPLYLQHQGLVFDMILQGSNSPDLDFVHFFTF